MDATDGAAALEPMVPETAVLLYVAADRLLPKSDAVRGAPLMTGEGYVPTTDLTRTLLASTIWNLREQGLLHLEIATSTTLGFLKRRHVRVTAIGHAPTSAGLAGSILDASRDRQGQSVKDVVRRWFVRDRANPYRHVIQAVVHEAAGAGVIDSDEMGSLKIGFVKVDRAGLGPKGQVATDRVAALEPACTGLLDRWNTFRRAEPDLCQALLDECGQAIKSRQSRAA